MRTKALLLSAALVALGVASSQAQVYSVNAVGYINVTLKAGGFTMVANQLDNMNGNLVSDLLATAPNGTIAYKYTSAGFEINSKVFGNWSLATMTLAPGEGIFVSLPAGTDLQVTLVGEVRQGTGLTVTLPQNFSIISSIVPQSVRLNDTVAYSFPGAAGDIVYRWDATIQNYSTHQYAFGSFAGDPTVAVGEAFWVFKAAAGQNWVRDFSVN